MDTDTVISDITDNNSLDSQRQDEHVKLNSFYIF